MTDAKTDTLLIYSPVPLYEAAGQLYIEAQAQVGLRLWAEHFAKVTAMMPVIKAPPPAGWRAYRRGSVERVTVQPLPAAYSPFGFAFHYAATRRRIARLLKTADVLCFAIGGLFGDWGAVACFAAHKQGRRFAVWADCAQSEVARLTADMGPLTERWGKQLSAEPMWKLEQAVIARADLGLFLGRETYDIYAPLSRDPHVVQDVMLPRSFQIADQSFIGKQRATGKEPLRIVYAGRADAAKGPMEWLSVLKQLKEAHVDFQANWLGDGPMLAAMRREIRRLGLEGQVELAGFVSDREVAMAKLRQAHLFMFCHKTPESPRCLIEALMSGTPLVGYDGAHPRDLTSMFGGGQFVPRGEARQLAKAVITLAQKPKVLIAMQKRARRDGQRFDRDSLFAHRSALLKQALGRPAV